MASTINASTSAGLVTTADTSGQLELQTANTTRITIDSSGNITLNNIIPSSSSAPTNGMFLPATNTVGLSTNSTERMRIDSSGNVLVTNPAGLGYGTGSGGTVTQATSKSTAVTLNKPTGQITMNNAALGSTTTVAFTLNNTYITSTDTVVVSGAGGFTGPYTITSDKVVSGACNIVVQNRSTVSLSDALLINFAIIKGATS